jgi:hypothetical protein
LIDRSLRPENGEDRFKQRKIDHLPARRATIAGAQRGQGCERAVEPGDHIGERERRKYGLAIGKSVAFGKAAHGFDQRAESRQRRVRTGLPEPR